MIIKTQVAYHDLFLCAVKDASIQFHFKRRVDKRMKNASSPQEENASKYFF